MQGKVQITKFGQKKKKKKSGQENWVTHFVKIKNWSFEEKIKVKHCPR